MSNIAILTDSTAYLQPEVVSQYNIHVVPLKIQWGDDSFLDGVDITPTEFYARLAQDPEIPTTSQPSVHDFLQAYESLAEQYEGIVAILISSGISGTVASATAAAAEFDKVPVEIVDTKSVAAGLTLAVMAAARTAEEGGNMEEIAEAGRTVASGETVFFIVDTLKYLHRGGRIGGASRYLGTVLSIKPILHLTTEGTIDSLERVRTKKKGMQRLADLAVEKAGGMPAQVCVMHADAEDVAAEFLETLRQRLNCVDSFTVELSPVVGTHGGPGTIGVAVYPEAE
jgi:DegV family protein with EDD domain